MNTRGILPVLCIFLLGCAYSVLIRTELEKQFDVSETFKSVIKVGMVTSANGVPQGEVSGTAWAIDGDHLVTASHVCMAFNEIRGSGKGKDIIITYLDPAFKLQDKIADINILFSDAANDVCLLEYHNHGLVPLKLAPSVRFGEKVYIVGVPLGLLGFIFEGRVASEGVDLSPILRNKVLVSAAATEGNSGGPVVNQNGEVIGILVAGTTHFDHFSICTGLSVLKTVTKLL